MPRYLSEDRFDDNVLGTTITRKPSLDALAGLFTIAHGPLFLYRTDVPSGAEASVATLDGLTRAELAATHPEMASSVTHVPVALAGSSWWAAVSGFGGAVEQRPQPLGVPIHP